MDSALPYNLIQTEPAHTGLRLTLTNLHAFILIHKLSLSRLPSLFQRTVAVILCYYRTALRGSSIWILNAEAWMGNSRKSHIIRDARRLCFHREIGCDARFVCHGFVLNAHFLLIRKFSGTLMNRLMTGATNLEIPNTSIQRYDSTFARRIPVKA